MWLNEEEAPGKNTRENKNLFTVLKEGSWEFGTEMSRITYREPGVMKEKGKMYGFNFSYTYRGWLPATLKDDNKSMLRLEGKYSWGEVDYRNSGSIEGIDDYMLEFRGLAGSDFPMMSKFIISPYAGTGYRYLNDDTGGRVSSTGAKGYMRESNYYYVPMGIEAKRDFNSGWGLGAVLEYDYFLSGRQVSHLSDVDKGYSDLKNDQKKGYGLRSSVKVTRNFGDLDFVFEPFIRYWSIAKSDNTNLTYSGVIIGYGYEPKNNSTEYGVRLAAKF